MKNSTFSLLLFSAIFLNYTNSYAQIDEPFLKIIENSADSSRMPTKSLTKHAKFDDFIKNKLNFYVPIISVNKFKDLYAAEENLIVLDTRSEFAFNTSHIPGAKRVGFQDFSTERVWNIDRNARIVVYCTVGAESEKVGKFLELMGFTNVENLYGSIIEWVNENGLVVDINGKHTRKVIVKTKEKKLFLKKGRAIILTKEETIQ